MWLQFIFYAFALLLIGSSLMVVISNHPVRQALFLVLAFFASAAIWMTLEAEFLALVLVLVYVGAVMTLFLFVIMMLNLESFGRHVIFTRYLPFGVLFVALLVALMIMVIGPKHFGLTQAIAPVGVAADYSNVKALGAILYTRFAFEFEIAGAILLTAIIAAISLAHRPSRNSRNIAVEKQVARQRNQAVRIVKMAATKPQQPKQGDEAQ